MDNINRDLENESQAYEYKKAKEPLRVSLSICILCVLLACLFVFMTTYVTFSLYAERMINKAYTKVSGMEKLLEVVNIFEEDYYYDIDLEAAVESLVGVYGYAAGDIYSYYYTAEDWAIAQSASYGNAKGIGVYVVRLSDDSIFVARVMSGGPAAQAGLKDGDIITAVNGVSVAEVGYDAAIEMIPGEEGTVVSFDVLRGSEEWEIDVTRGTYDPQTVFAETVKVEDSLYGYLYITQFEGTTSTQFITAMEKLIDAGVEGFVFDVRDNPGGDLWAIVEILDYLLPQGPIIHILETGKDDATTYYSAKSEVDLPMIVLANENTASAAELFTAALRDYQKAEIVGATTFGKGCGQTSHELSDGSVFWVTSFLYSPPFSDNYDGVGIQPDYEISLDEEWKNMNLFLVPHEEDAPLSMAIDILHETNK